MVGRLLALLPAVVGAVVGGYVMLWSAGAVTEVEGRLIVQYDPIPLILGLTLMTLSALWVVRVERRR